MKVLTETGLTELIAKTKEADATKVNIAQGSSASSQIMVTDASGNITPSGTTGEYFDPTAPIWDAEQVKYDDGTVTDELERLEEDKADVTAIPAEVVSALAGLPIATTNALKVDVPDNGVIKTGGTVAPIANGITAGDFTTVDANGNLVDSGHKDADYQKIQSSATANDFAIFDSNGQVVDSGLDESDFIVADAQALPKIVNSSVVATSTQITELTENKTTVLSAQSTDTQYPSAKATYDSIEDVREVAEGKTATYVVDDTVETAFASQNDTITITTSFTDIQGVTHLVSDLKIGDNFLVTQTDVPDRWVSVLDAQTSTATLNKLETAKQKVTDVQINGTTIVNATTGVANIPKADSSTLGVIKSSPNEYFTYVDNSGKLGATSKSYSEYTTLGMSTSFIGKGTLENVLDNESVRFDKTTSLSTTQQAQARSNIGAGAPYHNYVADGTYLTDKTVVLSQAEFDAMVEAGTYVEGQAYEIEGEAQPLITSSNKLSADLIADGTTNIIPTANDEANWNAKSTVVPSTSTVEGASTALSIKVNGTDYNLGGGSGGTSDFDQLTNRPSYNGTVMTHSTNIPEVKTATWDGKSTVTVSPTGTATDEVQYITIDGVEKKLAGGGGGGSTVTVSTSEVSGASVARSINVNGTDYNMPYGITWTILGEDE